MSTRPKYSACSVCGKLTTLKCRPCTDVGVDLFFCSPECQKLVRALLRVCNGRIKLTSLALAGLVSPSPDVRSRQGQPAVSSRAVASRDSKRSRENPIVTGGGFPMTLAGDLEGVSHDRFEVGTAPLLSFLTRLIPATPQTVMNFIGGPLNDCSALPNKPYLVSIVRSTRRSDPTQNTAVSLRKVPRTFVADHVSMLVCGVCSSLLGAGILPEKVIETSWWTPLVHRLVLLSAIAELALQTCDPKYFSWTSSARLRLVQWLHGGMNIGDSKRLWQSTTQ